MKVYIRYEDGTVEVQPVCGPEDFVREWVYDFYCPGRSVEGKKIIGVRFSAGGTND
jgi:hypothetical protein